MKPFVKDLKEVYQAPTEEMAFKNLDTFEETWGNIRLLLAHGGITGHSFLHTSNIHRRLERSSIQRIRLKTLTVSSARLQNQRRFFRQTMCCSKSCIWQCMTLQKNGLVQVGTGEKP